MAVVNRKNHGMDTFLLRFLNVSVTDKLKYFNHYFLKKESLKQFIWILIIGTEIEESIFNFTSAIIKQANIQKRLLLWSVIKLNLIMDLREQRQHFYLSKLI